MGYSLTKSNIIALPKRPTKTRLPVDWKPDGEYAAFARSGGLNPDFVGDRFHDYWCARAGADACKADWLQTWRDWCRRNSEWHEPDGVADPPKKPEKARGYFFTIDRRVWAEVCKLDINAMVAYVLLSAGKQKDLRTTTWSAKAIEKYTKISRIKAAEAIATLIRAGLIRQLNTGFWPRYWMLPADEIPGCEGYGAPVPMTARNGLYLIICSPVRLDCPHGPLLNGEGATPARSQPNWSSLGERGILATGSSRRSHRQPI